MEIKINCKLDPRSLEAVSNLVKVIALGGSTVTVLLAVIPFIPLLG